MYSRKTWGGSIEPFIMVKFLDPEKEEDKPKVEDPIVSVVVWEWKDFELLGKPADLPVGEVTYATPSWVTKLTH